MKIFNLATLLLLVSLTSIAQNNEINASIGQVAAQVKDVQTLTDQLSQKLTQVSGSIVELTVTTTDTKGKTSLDSYKFNLADVSSFAVKELVAAKVMYVEVPIKDGDNYIEHNKDGEFKSYDSELRITAYDIDNARDLINKLKTAIALAEKVEQEKYNYASLDAVLPSLYASIKSTIDNEYLQSITSVEGKKEKLSFKQEKSGTTSLFEFNLYDIAPATVKVKATGKSLSITLATINAQKVIKLFENDIPKAYTNKLTIYPADIENAKQIKNLLQLAIKFTLPDQPVAPVASNTSISTDNTNSGSSTNTAVGNGNFNFSSDAEAIANRKQPDFANQPHWLGAEGSINNFEKAPLQSGARSKGLYGASGFYYLNGTTSTVRFNTGSPAYCIVRLDPEGTDPSDIIGLYELEINKKNDTREYESQSRSGMGTSVTSSVVGMPLQFKKIASGYYLVISAAPLPPGEYAFGTEKFFFAFTVE